MKKWIKENFINLILAFDFIVLDQLSKFVAVKLLEDKIKVIFIKDFFGFYLTYNTGAAFSILEGSRLLLSLISIVACIIIGIYYIKGSHHKVTKLGLAILFAGAFGNGIDRVLYGKVTDFIYVNIFYPFQQFIPNLSDFPIFNVADLCVTFGAIMMLVGILFFEKEK